MAAEVAIGARVSEAAAAAAGAAAMVVGRTMRGRERLLPSCDEYSGGGAR